MEHHQNHQIQLYHQVGFCIAPQFLQFWNTKSREGGGAGNRTCGCLFPQRHNDKESTWCWKNTFKKCIEWYHPPTIIMIPYDTHDTIFIWSLFQNITPLMSSWKFKVAASKGTQGSSRLQPDIWSLENQGRERWSKEAITRDRWWEKSG